MTPPPAGGAVPATPVTPIARGGEATGEDALAFDPAAPEQGALPAAALPQDALPVVVAEDPRTQLERLLPSTRVDAVFRATRQFNDTVGDDRSVDPLTLGLLWWAEGGAVGLTISLDPNRTEWPGEKHREQIDLLIVLQPYPDHRRAYVMSLIGSWGFGLDDVIMLDPGPATQLDFAQSTRRWTQRMLEHGDWPYAVPFLNARGSTNPQVVTARQLVQVSYTTEEAVGFMVAVAARFTKQLWLLPAELEKRGITLSTDRVEDIPMVEPVLAYMCYLQRAPKAAAIWEALLFLQELSRAVELAAPSGFDPGVGYDLFHLIDVLNRWLGPLRDSSELGLPRILLTLVKDDTARLPGGRLGRHVLTDVAARGDWDPIPAQLHLDAEGRALLEELVSAWLTFAWRVGSLPAQVPPGELFFQGADKELTPLLFPNVPETLGFGARNYGRRFRDATELPLGSQCRRA